MFPPRQVPSDTILSDQNFLLLQPNLKTAICQATVLDTPLEVPTLEQREGLLWHQGKVYVPQPVIAKTMWTLAPLASASRAPTLKHGVLPSYGPHPLRPRDS